jgi:hypothetical protein
MEGVQLRTVPRICGVAVALGHRHVGYKGTYVTAGTHDPESLLFDPPSQIPEGAREVHAGKTQAKHRIVVCCILVRPCVGVQEFCPQSNKLSPSGWCNNKGLLRVDYPLILA